MNRINASEVEESLQTLPGIHAARVSLEENQRTIDKLHVLIAPERTPKKAVRDIESFLLLRFNLRMDYRKISLVQGSADTMRPALRPRPRLVFVGWNEADNNDTLHIEVRLELEEQEYCGSAEGPCDAPFATLVAQATIAAVQTIVTEETIRLVTAQVIPFGDKAATLVGILVDDEPSEEEMLGASFVRDDPATSAARATLDALNRRFFSAW